MDVTVLYDASNNSCNDIGFPKVAESWTPPHARQCTADDIEFRSLKAAPAPSERVLQTLDVVAVAKTMAHDGQDAKPG